MTIVTSILILFPASISVVAAFVATKRPWHFSLQEPSRDGWLLSWCGSGVPQGLSRLEFWTIQTLYPEANKLTGLWSTALEDIFS